MTVQHAKLAAAEASAPYAVRVGALALSIVLVGLFLFEAARTAAGIVA